MGYAESLLADGEHIELRTRQHWFAIFAYIGWFWAFAAATVLFFLLGRLVNLDIGGVRPLYWLTLIALVLAVGWAAWRWLNWRFQDYIVTNRRVMKVEGILNKESADSSLEKINDAVLKQGILGRLLGYGDLEIMTAAESSVDKFEMLHQAAEFKKAMLNAKYTLEREVTSPMPSAPLRMSAAVPEVAAPMAAPQAGSDGTAGAGVATDALPSQAPAAASARRESADAMDTLARLAELRDRGAITPEDYEAKKQELLGRL